MANVSTWIIEENLDPLIRELAEMAGSPLDEGIRSLFLHEIGESNSDGNPRRLASCVFERPTSITARIGKEVGAGLLWVELDLDNQLRIRAEVTLELMKTYRFTERSSS